jgi:K+-sensing histidine kinase KdpD
MTSAMAAAVRDFGPAWRPTRCRTWPSPSIAPMQARERATGGVGLGLYLCKLVAQAHGGQLELANAAPGFEATVGCRPR